jgi:hypothetical protein
MSEYVVELGDPHRDDDGDVECAYEQRERIIRCRDCKHFEDVMGAFECEQSSGEPHHAEPDGFCSWAEPREEE